jgi:hypothetical protein
MSGVFRITIIYSAGKKENIYQAENKGIKTGKGVAMKALEYVFIIVGLMSGAALADQTLRAELQDDRVNIYVDDQLFTAYKFADDQKYPYFYPVNGPASGESVTTESTEPYPHHHSLFLGCDKVNGGNYWQEGLDRGRIDSRDVHMVYDEGQKIEFYNHCVWQRPGAPVPFKDTRKITITAPSNNVRIIDFEIVLHPQVDVTIQKTNHSLFSARMKPELSVKEGGAMINSRGGSGEANTAGQPAEWIDYYDQHGDAVEGLAIMDHPRNPWHPSTWFTRDYGFFSPTPLNWLEAGKLEIPQGHDFPLKYRVVVHSGDHKQAGIAKIYKEWVKE